MEGKGCRGEAGSGGAEGEGGAAVPLRRAGSGGFPPFARVGGWVGWGRGSRAFGQGRRNVHGHGGVLRGRGRGDGGPSKCALVVGGGGGDQGKQESGL